MFLVISTLIGKHVLSFQNNLVVYRYRKCSFQVVIPEHTKTFISVDDDVCDSIAMVHLILVRKKKYWQTLKISQAHK